MSSNKRRKNIVSILTKYFHKKQILIIVAIIILIGSGYGIFVFINSSNKKAEIPKVIKTPEQQVDQIVANSILNNDKKTAQIEFKKLADGESDIVKKSVYLYASADLYYNSKDYENGIEVAKNIDELVKTSTSAGSVAHGYMMINDYANAAIYYQTAADRVNKPVGDGVDPLYSEYLALKREAEAKIQ